MEPPNMSCGNCERKMGMRSWWQSFFKTIILLCHDSLKAELHTGYSFYVKPRWENKKTELSSLKHVFIQCQILIYTCVRWERGWECNTERCCVISVVQSLILQAEHLHLHVFSALLHTRTHIRNTLQVPKKQNRGSRSWPALVWTDCVQNELRRENKCTYGIHTCTSSRTEHWQPRQTGLLIQQALWGLRDHCNVDLYIMVLAATSPHLPAVTEQAGSNRAPLYKTKRSLLDVIT